jgi:hypothetical protein
VAGCEDALKQGKVEGRAVDLVDVTPAGRQAGGWQNIVSYTLTTRRNPFR